MLNKDWAEYQVQLQPLARKLSEEMNRQEYEEAEVTAMRLSHVAHMLSLYAAGRNEMKGGTSYYG